MAIGYCGECAFYDECDCGNEEKDPHGRCYVQPPTQTYGKVGDEWVPISYTEREVYADRPGCRFWRA